MAEAFVSVEIEGLEEAIKNLNAWAVGSLAVMSRTMHRVGSVVFDRARLYAPFGPTQADLDRAKAARTFLRGFRGRAPLEARPGAGRTVSLPKPGGLQNSIEMDSSEDGAEIFVAANSEAGVYAEYIHDEKGENWFNRGPGTVRKGPQADEKFIERALDDSIDDIFKIIESEQNKAKKRAGFS